MFIKIAGVFDQQNYRNTAHSLRLGWVGVGFVWFCAVSCWKTLQSAFLQHFFSLFGSCLVLMVCI